MDFTLKINASQATAYLAQVTQQIGSPAPLMAVIAHKLESLTQEAFRQGGTPKWKDLAASTKKSRAKKGKWPGQILVVKGGSGLLGSVHSGSTSNTAFVGAGSGKSAKYAGIHQFGGQAGRGKKVRIEARPYLPFTGKDNNAQLTPAAERAIMQLAMHYIDTVTRGS